MFCVVISSLSRLMRHSRTIATFTMPYHIIKFVYIYYLSDSAEWKLCGKFCKSTPIVADDAGTGQTVISAHGRYASVRNVRNVLSLEITVNIVVTMIYDTLHVLFNTPIQLCQKIICYVHKCTINNTSPWRVLRRRQLNGLRVFAAQQNKDYYYFLVSNGVPAQGMAVCSTSPWPWKECSKATLGTNLIVSVPIPGETNGYLHLYSSLICPSNLFANTKWYGLFNSSAVGSSTGGR